MSSNQISNARHAGGVLELGLTQETCRIYGAWGIVGITPYHQVQPGSWLVTLEQPLRFDGSPAETVNGVPWISYYATKAAFIAATLGIEIHPEPTFRGHILVTQYDTAGAPLAEACVVSLLVDRIPVV